MLLRLAAGKTTGEEVEFFCALINAFENDEFVPRSHYPIGDAELRNENARLSTLVNELRSERDKMYAEKNRMVERLALSEKDLAATRSALFSLDTISAGAAERNAVLKKENERLMAEHAERAGIKAELRQLSSDYWRQQSTLDRIRALLK